MVNLSSGSMAVLVVCFLSCMLSPVFATQASEREAQNVEVTFYQLTSSEWTSSETAFKTALAAEAVTYCTSNAATCGLTSGFLFTTTQIGVASGPTEDSKSLKISFYIDFPTVHVVDSSSSTTYVVNSAAVDTILKNARDDLETAVGHDITYIGDEFYGISPAATANKIIIPVAFIVLLAVIILAVALHMWNKRKEEAQKKKQRALDREKRKKSSRIAPIYTEAEEKQSTNFWPRRFKRKKKEAGEVPTLSMKTNMITYDSKSQVTNETEISVARAPKYEDPALQASSTLPPLPNQASEDDRRREQDKKERKRRRKEKKRRQENHEEGREASESEDISKTESLEKSMEQTIIPVEDEAA